MVEVYHYAGLSSTKPPPGASVGVSFSPGQENVEERWDGVLLDALRLEPDAADFDRTDLSAAIT